MQSQVLDGSQMKYICSDQVHLVQCLHVDESPLDELTLLTTHESKELDISYLSHRKDNTPLGSGPAKDHFDHVQHVDILLD